MALFHLSVTQTKRSAGQSAIASAAYRAGERLYSEYYGEYNDLVLTGKLWTYLADLNEQAQERLESIIQQMKNVEGVTEELKACDQMAWVRAMNSIRNRAAEIVRHELIYDAKEVL